MNLQKGILETKDKWMNEDLLKKVSENPKLLKLFSNPEYMQAITMMQHNPREVMAKYGSNPEFVELLNAFSMMMGDHFTSLSNKDEQNKQGAKPNTAIPSHPSQDPIVQEILRDQKVVAFVKHMEQNPQVDFYEVRRRDPELADKLKILIDKGFFMVHA
eukprot:TRINITY_DN8823_c0_g2_i2.p1 TRINITY_DN8823_c0_g2~~TRINITY_DN8823_c0_g2_i2.p1  ORF type:complete len:159 (-),score=18.98 TRINITY_DN8823_c0_g2_i2:91-567(-)